MIAIRQMSGWVTHPSRWAVIAVAVLASCHAKPAPEGLQGVIEYEERQLAFEAGGRILAIDVDEGDRVAADQVIATLDDVLEQTTRQSREKQAAAATARAELVRAGPRKQEIRAVRAKLNAARRKEELLKDTLERHRRLQGTPAASSAAVVNEVEARYRSAIATRTSLQQELVALVQGARPQEIADADATAKAAEAALALETERLRRFELRSPIAGEVLEVAYEPGELAAAGAPIVSIADTTHPYVDVFVPQGELGGIRVGTSADVKTDSVPKPLHGTVEWIARRTEFTPRFLFSERERPNLVVRVRIRIDDPERLLHAGVPAFAKIDRGAPP